MMADNGPTTPNCSFIYDTAVYYDELDPSKAEIQKLRDKLEHNKWGFSVCDPHRDGQGEQMKRFKQSFQDSRHAIVFLSPAVLERMNTDKEDGVEFKMLTFLAGILESHDVKLKRRLIPVVFGIGDGNFQKPFLLSDFSILRPEKKGFHRHLYRSLSKLAGQHTITQTQIRQRVDVMGRDRYTGGVVTEVATGLDIPEEVLKDVKREYGGHKAMLIEVLECWRLHGGPAATAALLDGVLERVVAMPPQSLVESPGIAETPPASPPITDSTDITDGGTMNVTDVQEPGNVIVYAGANSVINLYQNGADTQAASPPCFPEPTVQPVQEISDEGFEDQNQAAVASASTSSTDHEEVLVDGVGGLGLQLDTPPAVEPTQGASAPATHPKEFYSLPAATTERTVEKGVRATMGKLFRRFSLKSTTDNKDKETSFLADLKKKFTRQRRSDDPSPMHRSASTSNARVRDNGSLMMTRRSSWDSGIGSTLTAQGQTNPAERLQEEEKMVSSLPNPPSDKVEGRKTEKTKKKKAEASAPLAAV